MDQEGPCIYLKMDLEVAGLTKTKMVSHCWESGEPVQPITKVRAMWEKVMAPHSYERWSVCLFGLGMHAKYASHATSIVENT